MIVSFCCKWRHANKYSRTDMAYTQTSHHSKSPAYAKKKKKSLDQNHVDLNLIPSMTFLISNYHVVFMLQSWACDSSSIYQFQHSQPLHLQHANDLKPLLYAPVLLLSIKGCKSDCFRGKHSGCKLFPTIKNYTLQHALHLFDMTALLSGDSASLSHTVEAGAGLWARETTCKGCSLID